MFMFDFCLRVWLLFGFCVASVVQIDCPVREADSVKLGSMYKNAESEKAEWQFGGSGSQKYVGCMENWKVAKSSGTSSVQGNPTQPQ